MTTFRTNGVRKRAMRAASTNTTTIGPTALPTVGMKLIRARPARVGRFSSPSRGGQAGHREPSDDLADLARQPCLGGRLVALGDRVDDDPADGPHLVWPEAAPRRGRRTD